MGCADYSGTLNTIRRFLLAGTVLALAVAARPVHAQEFETPLESGLDRLRVVVVPIGVATGLGFENRALRQSTALAQHLADPALAFAVAIPGRRIDVVERAVERGAHRRQRICFGYAIGKGLRHVSELGTSHGDWGHHQASLAERNPVD